jgi:hypothetical protein
MVDENRLISYLEFFHVLTFEHIYVWSHFDANSVLEYNNNNNNNNVLVTVKLVLTHRLLLTQ